MKESCLNFGEERCYETVETLAVFWKVTLYGMSTSKRNCANGVGLNLT